MHPMVGRVAFTMAILFTFLSLLSLPYLITQPESPSFVVNVLALCFSLIFLLLVVWEIRREVKKELYGEVKG